MLIGFSYGGAAEDANMLQLCMTGSFANQAVNCSSANQGTSTNINEHQGTSRNLKSWTNSCSSWPMSLVTTCYHFVSSKSDLSLLRPEELALLTTVRQGCGCTAIEHVTQSTKEQIKTSFCNVRFQHYFFRRWPHVRLQTICLDMFGWSRAKVSKAQKTRHKTLHVHEYDYRIL